MAEHTTTGLPDQSRPPFVGREQERARLGSRLDDALAGHGQLVLLVGEPGIGKTRLAESLADEASRCEVAVLWGQCYEWEGAPAYWPWIQILRAHLKSVDTAILRAQLGSGGPDISQILPELRELLPDLSPPPAINAEQARFQLFDAITTLFKQVAQDQPLVLILEDLHWADEPSLLLLQFVIREMRATPLLILGSYRNVEVQRHHPLTRALAGLTREPVTDRILLHRFSRDEVAQFIESSISGEANQGVTERVWQETEGNAFFVTEVVRLLADEGWLDAGDAGELGHEIPESIRAAIGQRLDRLSAECNELLAIAAVIGREFTLAMLEQITMQPAVELLGILDEAVQAQIIEQEASFGSFRFTHVLITETLYDELAVSERFQYHSRAGDAIEQLHATNLAPYYGDLARHYARAPLANNIDKAITYAVKAGDQAMDQLAWESAVIHYNLALQTIELLANADPSAECDVLLALASAQHAAGSGRGTVPGSLQANDALATYWKAVDAARAAAGSPTQLAVAAVGAAGMMGGGPITDERAVPLLEEVLATLPTQDSLERTRVQAHLAMAYRDLRMRSGIRYEAGTEETIRALSESAVAMARRLGDPDALILAHAAQLFVKRQPENVVGHLERIDDLLRIDQRHVSPERTDLLTFGRCNFLLELGEVNSAKRCLAELIERYERFRRPSTEALIRMLQTGFAIDAAEYAEAEKLIMEMDQFWPNLGSACNQLFAVYREQGRIQDIEERLQTMRNVFPGSPWFRVLWILYLFERGQKDGAHRLFEQLDVQDISDLATGFLIWLHVLAVLAELSVAFNDTHRAQELYELLRPHADHNIYGGYMVYSYGSVSQYLGLLATVLEEWDAAEQHLADAQVMHERMELPAFIAYTRFAWAEMLLQRGRPGDRDRATALLDQTIESANEYGMVRLQKMAAELNGKLEPAKETNRYGLTPRELDVLRLAVDGLTDGEIAEELYLSPRTVSSYLSSVYNKLGVNSRTAAATLAVREGVLQPPDFS